MCTPKEDGEMGFKDLKAFNLALLAKQGWWIQQSPNFLVHKIFQAKYFSDGSFRDAKLGKRPSYVWRSLMAARGGREGLKVECGEWRMNKNMGG